MIRFNAFGTHGQNLFQFIIYITRKLGFDLE